MLSQSIDVDRLIDNIDPVVLSDFELVPVCPMSHEPDSESYELTDPTDQ